MASLLTDLSAELLHCVLCEIDPPDLAAVALTCRSLYASIKHNRLLHKDLYLRRYDGLKGSGDTDWEDAIHKAVTMEKILQSNDREVKTAHLGFVAEQVNVLLDNARPDRALSASDDSDDYNNSGDSNTSLNVKLLSDYFEDQDNIDVFLCSSSLFARAGTEMQRPASSAALQQASAKLHCLYGKPVDPVPTRRSSTSYAISAFFTIRHIDVSTSPSSNTRNQHRGVPAHMVARSKVYDLREYTDHTLWGPFMDDGSQDVDWEKVEAVMLVLGFNLSRFTERSDGRFPAQWDRPFDGATPDSFISPEPQANAEKDESDEEISTIRELSPSIDSFDPYGVTGTWMRVVCFLDYNDLYAFNFSTRLDDDQPREPIDTQEAIRLIRIKLQVTKIEPPGSADDDEEEDGMDWSNFRGERLPIVHFTGSSRSLHASWDPNANSRIRGSVRQTPQGEIRWTTFSIFHGEERWRSEGIQVGGLRSARGILGNWFDKDYDMHGPAGPTAFWKVSDELEEEKNPSMPIAFF